MAESEEELKSLLMRVKEESENAGIKFNIQKIKIMIEEKKVEQWHFIFMVSKITADG